MIPINNSDTTWLIVTDYNQDNNILYEDLREDIYNPAINHWSYDSRVGVGVGVGGGSGVVGGTSCRVGDLALAGVGDLDTGVGEVDLLGDCVGDVGGNCHEM